jgi:Na+-driven multidrug efflux pump
LSFLPALGLNQAIAAIVGQWIGRKDVPRAKARTYTAMRLAVAYMTFVGVTLAVFGGPLIRIAFSQNPEVIQLGWILLILCAAFQGFDAVNIVLFGALRGVGDTRWMMWATFLGGYLVFLPVALVLAFVLGWGAIGAWLGATVYIVLLSGVVFLRFRGEGWRSVRIFESDMAAD